MTARLVSMMTLGLILVLGVAGASFAASPPERLNFQGTLRDATGAPADGDYAMIFRFFGNGPGACDCGEPVGSAGCSDAACEVDVCAIDAFCCTTWDTTCAQRAEQIPSCQACIADEWVLQESHAGAGTPPVVVTDGLFNVALGSGDLADGAGTGTYATLGELFRDYDVVYIETTISGEALSPRVRVEASAYAQNARQLEGKTAAEFIDTSADTQTKAGNLIVGMLSFPGGSNLIGDASSVNLSTSDFAEGALAITEGGDFNLISGNGNYLFFSDSGNPEGTVLDLLPGFAGGELTLGDVSVLTGGGSADSRHTHSLFNSLRLADGSAGSPTLVFDNEVNTGIFRNPGGLSVSVSGSERLWITDGAMLTEGSVGIACGSPVSACDANKVILADTDHGTGLATLGSLFVSGRLYLGSNEFLDWDGSRFTLSDDLHFESSGATVRSITNSYDIVMRKDEPAASTNAWFRWWTDSTIEQMRIVDGDEAAASFDGAVNANGIDYAEAFLIVDKTLEAGDVVTLSLSSPGYIDRATVPYAANLVGVISERPGFVTGNSFDAEEAVGGEIVVLRQEARRTGDLALAKQYTEQLIALKKERQRPVALAGRVPVKVDGAHGPIAAGDFLTSSSTPGHAMAMTGAGRSIGIALEPWSGPGQGRILAFINPGYHGPAIDGGAVAPVPATVKGTDILEGNLRIVLDGAADDDARLSVFHHGSNGLDAELMRLDEQGNLLLKGALRPDAMDLAEYFTISEQVEVGDVLIVDRENEGSYRLARTTADPAVVGIVSAKPGVLLGAGMTRIASADAKLTAQLEQARAIGDTDEEARVWKLLEKRFLTTHAPVALSGTVLCKVDAGFGAIRPGDLLTTSPTPGHAQRAEEAAPGTIVGKALESLADGTGLVRVLVMMR